MKTIEFENDVIKNNLFDKNRKKTVDFISKSLGFINIKRKGGENEKIFRVLLIVMLLIATGCNKEGNGGGKPALKTTEIGDGLINSYRSTGKYSKVERDYLPKEIADIGLDYIVYEQESDYGTIKGFTVVINDKDKDAIVAYMENLANSTYENLVKEDAGMIVIYYNNEIPVAISVVIMDFSDEFCAIMYESMPATVDDFYDWRY